MIIIVLDERKVTDLVAIVHQLVSLKKHRRCRCTEWYYILLRRCYKWFCKQNFHMHWVLVAYISMPLPSSSCDTFNTSICSLQSCSYATSPVQQVALAEWRVLIGFPIPLDSCHFLSTAWNEKRDVSKKLNYVEKIKLPVIPWVYQKKYIMSNKISFFSDLEFI